MSYQCVPLYDTLGENAVEYIVNHSEAAAVFVEASKVGKLAGAFKAASGGIAPGQVKAVVYWGSGPDAAGVQVGV
jgi:long-chain acyl-CoA synthetase